MSFFMFARGNQTAWFVLLTSLGLTTLVAWGLHEQNHLAATAQFELQAQGIVDDIEARMRRQQQILLGGAGLVDASDHVSREEWRAYVARLNLKENYPGIQGVGFSVVVQPDELRSHITAIRAEGFPEYTVRPPGERPLYTSIVYLEPFAGRNLAAFGFDMFSEPTRRAAMTLATESGRTAVSGRVKLVQENQGKTQAGILMYVPVYRKNLPLDTPEARWKAIHGFVYSPYRMGDLMHGVLGEVNAVLDFTLHDGTTVNEDALLYASAEDHAPDPANVPRYTAQKRIALYGTTWTASFHSRPAFEAQFGDRLAWVVLLCGGGLSMALFALTTSLAGRREKALALAEGMTARIRESEQRFRLILETSPTAARIALAGGRKVMFSNQRYAELLNVPPDRVEGVDPSTYYADRAVYEDVLARLGRGEPIRDLLVELNIPGAGTKWTLASYFQIEYEGQPAVLGWFHDITDSHRVRMAMEQFKATLDGTMDCVFMFDADALHFFYANQGALQQVGYEKAELFAMHPYDIKPDFDEARFRAFIAPMLEGKLESTVFETVHQSKNGNLIPVEIFLQLFRQDDRPPYFVAIVRDIKERKQAEIALKEQAQRTQTILDNVIDGIITIDSLGKVASFNTAAEKIFGYTASEVIGNNVRMLMPEPHRANHDGYLHNYMTTGVARIIGIGREVEGQRKDGSLFPMDLAISEISDQGRRMFIGLVRDITERKRVERMKTEFVSTVSHELRTPLTSIRGSLGLITGGVLGALPEQVQNMLAIASNNTERLLMLINDILDMQKIEAGKMAFRFENVALMPLLDRAVADLSTYGEQHKVRFEIRRRIDDAHVFADRDRLMQVLANLMSNAAKFSPPDSAVEIAVARHGGGRLRISITDVGAGIPEDFKARIFSPFTQSDSSDTRSKGGTGLGLAITKAIVERHGGQIGFVSREGIGTTFYVELPEMVGDSQTDQPRVLPAAHGACVLIVEDDPDIAALIQRMLTEAGLNSDIAYSAAQARQLLAENDGRYRLMTLDLMLPDEDGMSLLESLRQEAATRDLPVVVVSVKADEVKQQLSGGAMGVMDWLQKPIDAARLISVVKAAATCADCKTRVLHVEDEPDVRSIVAAMLQGQCDLVGVDSVARARAALTSEPFDLVLLDIGLPDGSGLDLIDLIEQRVTPPRIVIFSASDVSEEYAERVSAVLVKSKTGNDELLRVLLQSVRKD